MDKMDKMDLVKSFRFGIEGLCRLRPIANKFCLGFLVPQNTVHLFAKRDLFDAGLSPDKMERRRISVEGEPVAMNTFSLLSFLNDWVGMSGMARLDGLGWMGLIKNNFWM